MNHVDCFVWSQLVVVAVPNRYCVYIVNAASWYSSCIGDFRYTNNDTYEKVPGKENDRVEKDCRQIY